LIGAKCLGIDFNPTSKYNIKMKLTKKQKSKIKEVLEVLVENAGYECYESGGMDKLDDVSRYLKEIEEIIK
jgi:hypothetical protein